MKEEKLIVSLPEDMDASPVALLVAEASRFDSRIYLESGNKRVNAKSIMGMMSFGLANGEEVLVTIDGEDEDDALSAMESFLAHAV